MSVSTVFGAKLSLIRAHWCCVCWKQDFLIRLIMTLLQLYNPLNNNQSLVPKHPLLRELIYTWVPPRLSLLSQTQISPQLDAPTVVDGAHHSINQHSSHINDQNVHNLSLLRNRETRQYFNIIKMHHMHQLSSLMHTCIDSACETHSPCSALLARAPPCPHPSSGAVDWPERREGIGTTQDEHTCGQEHCTSYVAQTELD